MSNYELIQRINERKSVKKENTTATATATAAQWQRGIFLSEHKREENR